MDETTSEREESWTDDGVQLVLEQPSALRSRRAGVWLFGLIALALASVPMAVGFLFVPALAPFLPISALFVALVFGWAFVPPLVVAWLNRPLPVCVGFGEMKVGAEVFERGSIRSIGLVDGCLEIERHDGPTFRSQPVAPVDPERLMRLLDFVEVSEDEAVAEQASRRAALENLRPLRDRVGQ